METTRKRGRTHAGAKRSRAMELNEQDIEDKAVAIIVHAVVSMQQLIILSIPACAEAEVELVDEIYDKLVTKLEAINHLLESIANDFNCKLADQKLVTKLLEELIKMPGLTPDQMIEVAEMISAHNCKMKIFFSIPANDRKDYVMQVLSDFGKVAGFIPSIDSAP